MIVDHTPRTATSRTATPSCRPNVVLRGLAGAGILTAVLAVAGCGASTTASPSAAESTAKLVTDERIADDSLAILGVYELDGVDIADDVDPNYEAVWSRFTQLVNVEQWPQITLFVALDRDASPRGTEGAIDSLATDPEQYYVALDVTGVQTPDEADSTMIHEFGHLVTLNPEQLPLDTSQADTCPVFTVNDRCAPEGSYFRAWLDQFWPGYLHADLEKEDGDAAAERFATGDFVSEYAATNPYEDIAETFDAWVREDATPTGNAIIDQRLRFFEDYPEVVQLKEYARQSLER